MSAQADHIYGPYRVIRPLGGGGMGTVLLAEDSRLGRLVALKTFAGSSGATPAARGRLMHEARAAARLAHPNIATVHDVLDIAGELVIVFEYVEGETLADRLLRGRLTVPEALRIGEQLADGLAAAHAQGVIHRDLKPGNVMLTPDGRAKILDFGIAQSSTLENDETNASLPTGVGIYAGTPAYAAPEQWLGESVGEHTDIFALGLVLFEMLGGRRLFDSKSRLALMQQVIEAPRPHVRELNPSVPPSVDALLDSALAREPQRRPASAREVGNILRAIARDQSTVELSPFPVKPRLRRRTIAAIVVLVATVIGLISMLRNRTVVSEPAPAPVVAVLPLTNATGSGSDDYLAAGLADSLTTSLASLTGITVLSRAAVLSVWTRDASPAKLARELGVNFFVEGSVQQIADRVRLTVNLVRLDQSVAWAESVEGTRDRVFDLQSRLATALGRALSVQITAADRAKLAQQPTGNVDALSAYWQGRALLERRDVKGNIDAALAAFDRAVQLDPEFSIAHAARGEALWARYIATRDAATAQEAIDASTTALRIDPNRANVRYALALALLGTGKLIEATEELQHALALQPNYDDARRELGNVLARQGKADEAVAEFEKAIALRPTYSGHYNALGRTFYNFGRYEQAVPPLLKSIDLQPDNALSHSMLGSVYQAMNRFDDAIKHYERSLSLTQDATPYLNIGVIHHQKGEYQQAIDAYRAAIKLRPNYGIAYRNLGDAYSRIGRRSDAHDAYREAVRLMELELKVNPRDPVNLSRVAVYLAKLGDFSAARQRLGEARQIAPRDAQVLLRTAVVHTLAGETALALDTLEQAIAAGYSRAAARGEEDFAALKSSARFQALVTEAPKGELPR